MLSLRAFIMIFQPNSIYLIASIDLEAKYSPQFSKNHVFLLLFLRALQDMLVDVKGAERDDTCQQYLPGRLTKLPLQLDPDTEGIKHEQQEQGTMDRTHRMN